MADPVVENFVFNFEAEHVFADSLWRDTDIRSFLESNGYQKNALGNLMAEFADADTVSKIQKMSANEPLKAALLDPNSRAGSVRHKGNASGGNQVGKNNFLASVARVSAAIPGIFIMLMFPGIGVGRYGCLRMVRYWRNFIPGGTWSFTVTLADRRSKVLAEHCGLPFARHAAKGRFASMRS